MDAIGKPCAKKMKKEDSVDVTLSSTTFDALDEYIV